MSTIYSDEDGKLYKWSKKLVGQQTINVGDPITIEYKKIKIVSKKFDFFGSSEIMVVNNIKTQHTKDKTVETVAYYDDDVSPDRKRNKFIDSTGIYTIGPFDPAEYGDSVCYFTPGYCGSNITITTKFWELNDPSGINKVTGLIDMGLGAASSIPTYGTYISLANKVIDIGSKILTGMIKHRLLADDHIVEMGDKTDKPFVTGRLICLPNVTDKNQLKEIIATYYVDDNTLVKDISNDKVEEYNDTYFILDVSNSKRDDLLNFDYAAMSSDVINKLNNKDDTVVKDVIDLTKSAFNMQTFDQIFSAYKTGDNQLIKALFNHIPVDQQKWFTGTFFNDVTKIING